MGTAVVRVSDIRKLKRKLTLKGHKMDYIIEAEIILCSVFGKMKHQQVLQTSEFNYRRPLLTKELYSFLFW